MDFFRTPATTALLLIGLIATSVSIFRDAPALRLPGNRIGYQPDQPIAYSHRQHAGEMQIPCLYCHHGAEKSRYAGIPPLSICMNCHAMVTTGFGSFREEDALAAKEKRPMRILVSTEIQKIYDALGLSLTNGKVLPDPAKPPKHIEWVKVHKLPDFVYFDHRPHVYAGVACQECHGPVERMEKMRQFSDLSMGWCVNCHRTVNKQGVSGKIVDASIDCSVCHY